MLNICFTVDHELFAGENIAAEEEIVIHPTYRLMEVLEEYNIPLCLMTDVCSIIRYRELEIDSPYVSMMEEQLRQATTRGHDVQLHIHPHWLTSEYIDSQWKFDYSKFRLHDFGFDSDSKQNGRRIIAEGKKYLEDLLIPYDPRYVCVAFRAGGWCIQPEKEFLEALATEGILIDTTVFYGGYKKSSKRFFDFRHVPNKPNWWINPKKGLAYDAVEGEGRLFEVTIGSYNVKSKLALRKLIYKPKRMMLKNQEERVLGTNIDQLLEERSSLHRMVDKVQNFLFQPIMFTFDSACLEVMMDLMTYYLERFDCANQEIYISIIGHSKILTEVSLKEIRKFCEAVSVKYSDDVRFIRLRDIPL